MELDGERGLLSRYRWDMECWWEGRRRKERLRGRGKFRGVVGEQRLVATAKRYVPTRKGRADGVERCGESVSAGRELGSGRGAIATREGGGWSM